MERGSSNSPSVSAGIETSSGAWRSMDLQLPLQRAPADADKTTASAADGSVKVNNRGIGSTSGSSSSSSTSSPPQYSEDLRCNVPALDLLPRQGSVSSTKTCEVDLGDEERDTYSPISSSNTPSDGECIGASTTGALSTGSAMCNGRAVDNKAYDGSLPAPVKKLKASSGLGSGSSNNLHSATKEEKQRQNEEIVILETSSISSETGSWESVFPHASTAANATAAATVATINLPQLATASAADDADSRNCCTEFLHKERNEQQTKLATRPKEKDKPLDVPGRAAARVDGHLEVFKDTEFSPLIRERTYSTGAAVTADTSSLFSGVSTSSLLRELERKNQLSNSGTSACFIDASSLRDEDEVLSFPSLDGQHSNDGLDAADMAEHEKGADEAESSHDPQRITNCERDIDVDAGNVGDSDDSSPTKKLESFHKSFAKCKVKDKEGPEVLKALDLKSHSSSSSNSGLDSPHKPISSSSTNNLSDEEKLWKREHQQDTQPQPAATPLAVDRSVHRLQQGLRASVQADVTEPSDLLVGDADSLDSSEVVKLRREREREREDRKPASYVFQHNMQQFSIHPLGASPKFAPHPHLQTHASPVVSASASGVLPGSNAHYAHSDLSYTTDYSSSSPAPSLVWSEYEQRTHATPAAAARHHLDEYDKRELEQRPGLPPDTPHNSIVHIDTASSNTSSIHRDCTLSSSLSQQRDSGAYCSDATDSPIPMPRTPKRSKFDEANPIVSGGASIKDFSIKQCESPPVKRRTEGCPIVSGGFVSLDFEPTRPLGADDDLEEEVELRAKPRTRKPLPGIASWVVDMSDCRPERRRSTSSNSSMDTGSVGKFRERSDSNSSHKSGCGFYVSLDDMDQKTNDVPTKAQMSKSYTGAPKSAGFFVNLSQSDYKAKDSDSAEAAPQLAQEEEGSGAERKPIFSMFIDIGGEKGSNGNNKREPFSLAHRLSGSLTSSAQRRSAEEQAPKSTASSTETLMAKSGKSAALSEKDERECKSLDYKSNIDPPITVAAIRRISQQQRAQSEAAKRHSWGNGQTKDSGAPTHDYKRSISLTANGDSTGAGDGTGKGSGGSGLMSIIDKLPLISKASSLSVDSSLSPYDEYTGSAKSGLSTCSNNSARNSMSGGEREAEAVAQTGAGKSTNTKKRRRDVQINETFDKSSLASITDGILSKDISPGSTDTDDLTFQQDEELANREAALQQQQQQQPSTLPPTQIPSNRSSAIIMETIMEAKETSSPKKSASSHTIESLHATIEKQKMLLETVNEHGEAEKSCFVKLSDMDKPAVKLEHSPDAMMSKSASNHRQINRLYRDDPKGRPHSWSMTRSAGGGGVGGNGTGHNFVNITNSVDNLRSLMRLFPDYSKEFSSSLPGDMVLDQMDYIQTDISADSSLASSFSRSGMDESSISCRQPRRLGEDLLKMFLQEIATDMVVEVHGRRIKAHKCILRSRCQYFAAMLAGHGAQSVVSLQGYSYSAVHFALCHIYSGASHPPDGISLMELAALADLLGLEGLKEVTAHALKTNYCHNFHKPCSGCIDGILQVLPVALNHALDDLYRKCLRWACRHYLKVWPTRQFAQLPSDILGRCRQQIVAYLTSETVLDTVLDCDNLLAQLAPYRWGGICENLVRDILEAAYTYIAEHFASLIASDAFLSLGHDRSCHIPRLERVLLQTAASLTADQACRSYQRVTRLNTVLQAKIIQMPANLGELAKELQGLQEEELDWDPEYIRLVSAILSAVEQCLIRQCSRAMRVTAWQRMDLDLRKKIQTLARLTEPLDMKRGKSVSKAFSFGGSTRNQDLYQVKLAIQAHSKRALAQDTQLYKATQTQDAANVQTAERGVQANNDLREGTHSKILKSNSRAHVPQSYRTSSQSATVSERNSINAHRRTQSEVPLPTSASVATSNAQVSKSAELKADASKPRANAPRLSDVRPRYLEPRKARSASSTSGPVRSATSSSIPATKGKVGRHISSSDSSRNSSPATRKVGNKIGTKSTNMSLDSLATPARRAKSAVRSKTSDTERYSDVGVDSLGDSMKSSVITSKTHDSRESLSAASKLSRSNPMLGRTKSGVMRVAPQGQNKLNGMAGTGVGVGAGAGTKQPQRPTTISSKTSRHLQQQHITSTGSSPSSVTTTKSATSRLSSVSSTHSTRELYKHRSISMPGQQEGSVGQSPAGPQRRSFLSAKSREILAKRAEKNKQLQEQQLQQCNSSGDERAPPAGPLRSASHSAVVSAASQSSISRNSLPPSNIPTRRPNTLQLKKTTNGLSNSNSNSNSKTNINQHNNNINKHKIANATNGVLKAAAQAVKHKIELLIDNSNSISNANSNSAESRTAATAADSTPLRFESKLERSSTFCKESSDLDKNDLQIIE